MLRKAGLLFNYSQCAPIAITLKPGHYQLEVWGASGHLARGGYASGYLNLLQTTQFFINLGSKGVFNYTENLYLVLDNT